MNNFFRFVILGVAVCGIFFPHHWLFFEHPLSISFSLFSSLILSFWIYPSQPDNLGHSASRRSFKGIPKYVFGLQYSHLVILFFCYFLLAFFFPANSPKLGDGFPMLELVSLHEKFLNYHFASTEFLDGIFRSLFHHLSGFPAWDTFQYSSLAYLAIQLCILLFWLVQEKLHPVSAVPFLLSNFMMVYWGYVETYSGAFTFLFLSLVVFRNLLTKKNISLWQSLGLATLVLLSFGVHVLNGFLIFPAIYFFFSFWNQTPSRIRLVLTGILFLGITILGIYFVYHWMDPNLEKANWSHDTNIFLKASRIFSLNHLKEKFAVILLSSLPTILLFMNVSFSEIWSEKKNRILIVSLLWFLIFLFIVNPLLGIPKDWDVLSFFAVPLSMLGTVITSKFLEKRIIPIFILPASFSLFLVLHSHLHSVDLLDRLVFQNNQKCVKNYDGKILEFSDPSNAIFLLEMDYFYFKRIHCIKRDLDSVKILNEYRIDLLLKAKSKQFEKREIYLKAVEANNLISKSGTKDN